MANIRIFLSLIFMSVIFDSCKIGSKKQLLRKGQIERIEFIDYVADLKWGNFINMDANIDNSKWHYNIKIDDSGNVLHVLKYNESYFGNDTRDLNAYRSLQLLISDTSDKLDPTFFGNPVNGYYNDTFLINNVIYKKDAVRKISSVNKSEIYYFNLIDSLTKEKKIKYVSFDQSKIVGWFKYEF